MTNSALLTRNIPACPDEVDPTALPMSPDDRESWSDSNTSCYANSIVECQSIIVRTHEWALNPRRSNGIPLQLCMNFFRPVTNIKHEDLPQVGI